MTRRTPTTAMAGLLIFLAIVAAAAVNRRRRQATMTPPNSKPHRMNESRCCLNLLMC